MTFSSYVLKDFVPNRKFLILTLELKAHARTFAIDAFVFQIWRKHATFQYYNQNALERKKRKCFPTQQG